MTQSLPESLSRLAQAYGVATEFWDWQGNYRPVSAATVRAVLSALGVDATDDHQASIALQTANDAPWRRLVPPVVVVEQGSRPLVHVHAADRETVSVTVHTEEGDTRSLRILDEERPTRQIDSTLTVRHTVDVPDNLPLGWHQLDVSCTGGHPRSASCVLVVYPRRLDLPPALAVDGEQQWGLMTQLYAMRSERSWGLGDLADLGDAGAWAAALGADFVLVNPLHAAQPQVPIEPSPYLPTTRRFVSPLYIRIEDVPEVAYLSAAERQLIEWHADDAQKYLELDFLERDPAWIAKEAALRTLFRQPRSQRRERAFHAFCEMDGQSLTDFATWCALSMELGPSWNEWPLQLQDPGDPAVEAFRAKHAADVEFYCWLQWILHEQLGRLQRDLLDTGMRIGVVHDLAVGVHPHGADAWALKQSLARGVTVGAPPDQYNQRGQDWSQPPWQPAALAGAGYAPYREMLHKVLRDAGGLRVDHVIGLFRLWWIPEGLEPHEGTYVRYDHEAMIGILMLEAHRAGAVIVGEDLGTVEPWVRDYLSERGIFGTSILWFERNERGPVPPERYRELCLATVTTHDLPPTAGYLSGVHMELRRDLGLLTRSWDEELDEDRSAREEVLAELRRRGLLRDGATITEQVEALHRYLTWAPAKLIGVSVSDLAQDTRIINQPGTHEEYPNWRVPLAGPQGRPILLEELFTLRTARRLARTVSRRS
ncbi:MAG: 4-alpha-glucanotransferase [Ornithinimicrobium sp.]